jgi:hypothetical protein
VPGIRCPGLIVTVEESRVWRETEADTEVSMKWLGTSVFRISGFKVFDVHQFPFDRQVINLGPLDFVWRRDQDTNAFEESMRVIRFSAKTNSMVQAWRAYPARVVPKNVIIPEGKNASQIGAGAFVNNWPTYCTQFTVRLRLQRRHEYYVSEIFFVSIVILFNSLWALGMSPSDDHSPERLAIFAGGMLTLITFKYGVAGHLPRVAYQTWLDKFLSYQIYTLILVSVLAVVLVKFVAPLEWGDAELLDPDRGCPADGVQDHTYPVIVYPGEGGDGETSHMELEGRCHPQAYVAYRKTSEVFRFVDHIEDGVMLCIMAVWALGFIYALRCKRPTPWAKVTRSSSRFQG